MTIPPNMTASKNACKYILCILVFFISLIFIFEVEIRSIGHLEEDPVGPIVLLSISWLKLSDIGMFLPILFVILMGKFRSILFNDRLMYFYIFSFLSGILMF